MLAPLLPGSSIQYASAVQLHAGHDLRPKDEVLARRGCGQLDTVCVWRVALRQESLGKEDGM
jgi:hypothetical protein